MDNYDIQRYNIYTLLCVKVGSSKEELYEAHERYKRLNANNSDASNKILSILEEQFRILEEIGLEEYNKRVIKQKDNGSDFDKRLDNPENQKDNRSDFDKWLDDPENQKYTIPPATARAIDYENQFMKKSTTDEVEFDISKVKNVNDAKIKKIGKKFVIIVLTVAVTVTGILAILSLFNNSKGKYVDDNSTSISYGANEKEELYEFDYIVEYGDTVDGLYERFKIKKVDNKPADMLREGDFWHIYTTDSEIAEEQQRIYDIKTTSPVMTEWEEYTIKPGDTPMSIAQAFGVDVNDLKRFNNTEYYSAIPDVHTCYAGDTIKIPTVILTGEDAYEYMQAKINENNSMKAVG